LLSVCETEEHDLPNYGQKPAKYRRPRPLASLTAPEIRVLSLFGSFPVLTSKRLQRIAGWSPSHTNNTLAELNLKGMLDFGYVPTPLTAEQKRRCCPPNKPEAIWRMTKTGLKRGQKENVIDADAVAPPARWDGDFIGALGDIKHRLLIVDIMVALSFGVRARDGYSFEFMKPDFILEKRSKNDKEKTRQTKDDLGNGKAIIPDLIAKIWNDNNGKSTMIYCEAQNKRIPPISSNPKNESITKKLATYGTYLSNPKRRFKGADQSIILYVANETTARPDGEEIDYLDHIQPLIDWDAAGIAAPKTYLSTFSRLDEDIFGPIWRNYRNEEKGLA